MVDITALPGAPKIGSATPSSTGGVDITTLPGAPKIAPPAAEPAQAPQSSGNILNDLKSFFGLGPSVPAPAPVSTSTPAASGNGVDITTLPGAPRVVAPAPETPTPSDVTAPAQDEATNNPGGDTGVEQGQNPTGFEGFPSPTSTEPENAAQSSNTVPAKYFYGTDNAGNTLGASDQVDSSGIPYFAYRTPGATATTTDYTRVATTFDPTVAKPMSLSTFYNARGVAARAALKTQMGGAYSDELDHTIALELAGSNNPANLRVESGRTTAGGESADFDQMENDLANKVVTGQMSLSEAQYTLAAAKSAGGDKNPVPTVPSVGPKPAASNPQTIDWNALDLNGNGPQKTITQYAEEAQQAKAAVGQAVNWGYSLGSSVLQHLGASLDPLHPSGLVATGQGALQASLQSLSFMSGIVASSIDQHLNPAISTVNALTHAKIPTNLIGKISSAEGGTLYKAIGGQDATPENTSDVFAAVRAANEGINRTPEQQQAYDTGNFLGWMVPYSKIAQGVEAVADASRAAEYAPKLAPLIPYISDAAGFLGTGQILHMPDEGTRVQQLKNDAIALALFDVGGFALKGGGTLLAKGLAKVLPAAVKETATAVMKPLFEKLQAGESVPADMLDNAVTQANNAVQEGTGKTPQSLLQEHLNLGEQSKIPLTPESVPAHNTIDKAIPMYHDQTMGRFQKGLDAIQSAKTQLASLTKDLKNVPEDESLQSETQKAKIAKAASLKEYIDRNKTFETYWNGTRPGDSESRAQSVLHNMTDEQAAGYQAQYKNDVQKHVALGYDMPKEITDQFPETKQPAAAPDLHTAGHATLDALPAEEKNAVLARAQTMSEDPASPYHGQDPEEIAADAIHTDPAFAPEHFDQTTAEQKPLSEESSVPTLEQQLRDAYTNGGTGLLAHEEPVARTVLPEDMHNDFGETGTPQEKVNARIAEEDQRVNSAPKVNRALEQIRTELDLSQAGSRYIPDMAGTHGAMQAHGIPSTFPKWLPENLRSKALFDKVFGTLDSDTLSFPKGARPKQRALYNEILAHVDDLTGIDTKPIRDRIMASYEKPTETEEGTLTEGKDQTPENGSGSPAGGEGLGTKEKEIKLPPFPRKGGPILGVAFPGADIVAKFIEKDVIEQFGGLKNAVKGIYDASKDLFSTNIEYEKAAAIVGSKVMEMEKFASAAWKVVEARRDWWAKVPEADRLDFIDRYQSGSANLADYAKYAPNTSQDVSKTLSEMAQNYKSRLDKAFAFEGAAGMEENYVKDYFPQMWKEPEKAQAALEQYFTKGLGSGYRKAFGSMTHIRIVELDRIGRELGLVPVTTNPEERVLTREIDGFRIATKISMMNELSAEGLAHPLEFFQGHTGPAGWPLIKNSDGKMWAVTPDAAKILNNAFFSKSFWTMNNGVGEKVMSSIFKTLMAAKGTVVPFQLSLSGFHPFHVQTIASADAITQSFMKVLNDEMDAGAGFTEMAKGLSMIPSISNIKDFWDIGKAWDTPMEQLEPRMRTAIQAILDGGGTPKISEEFRVRAGDAYKKAVADGNYIGAGIRLLPKIPEALQEPILGHYVPALKIGAYLSKTEDLLHADPTLATNDIARKVAFRAAWKEVDSRFGEMVYKTKFWNPLLTQVGQASFLSLGWQLGFVDQFGGGALDLAKLVTKAVGGPLGLTEKATRADLTSRTVFSVVYTIQAAMWGGLMTYAMTGKMPQSVQDLFYPNTGKTNSDGSAARLNTPFYTREFFGLTNHIQKQGILGGPIAMVQDKANPILSSLAEIWNNKDFYQSEIRDPNSNIPQQAEQVLAYLVKNNFTPISIQGAIQANNVTGRLGVAASLAGFNPAPKYIAQNAIQTKIFAILDERNAGTKPLDSQAATNAKSNIKKLYQSGDSAGANTALKAAIAAGYIKSTGLTTFMKDADLPGDVLAFKDLVQYPSDQQALLASMSEADLQRYAQYAANSVKQNLSSLSPTAAQFIKDIKSGKIKVDTFKAGKIVTP